MRGRKSSDCSIRALTLDHANNILQLLTESDRLTSHEPAILANKQRHNDLTTHKQPGFKAAQRGDLNESHKMLPM
jgi:hypothetical protein